MNSYSTILFLAMVICCSFAANQAKVEFPNCLDSKGKEVVEGRDFIPPENHCIHCLCFKGDARFCESLPCEQPPPANCKKWTEYCCVYTCHDNEYNEMDGYHLGGGYDSEENTRFNKLKKYAGKLWDKMMNMGKRNPPNVHPVLNVSVNESTGKHQLNTPVSGLHIKHQNHAKNISHATS